MNCDGGGVNNKFNIEIIYNNNKKFLKGAEVGPESTQAGNEEPRLKNQ